MALELPQTSWSFEGMESRGLLVEGTWQAQLISVCNNGPFCMGSPNWFCLWHGPDGERVWQGAWRRRPGVHDLCACVMGKVGTHTAHLGLMFTPRPTHTVTRLAHVRVHTHTLSCVPSVACTLSDTAQLTFPACSRSHPAYTLSGLTYPQTEFLLTCLDTTTHSGVLPP